MPQIRLLLIAVVAISSGCVPEKIVWLTDSSGFVFTTGPDHERIVHYHVQKQIWRVIVDNSRGRTPLPGIGPDGSCVAVARCLSGDKCYNLQILIYDMDGRLRHQSANYLWRHDQSIQTPPRLHEAAVAWCPKTDRLLISAVEHAGYYDYRTKLLNHLPDDLMPIMEGPSPFRPDGAGFIAERRDKQPSRTVFHRWTGDETEITGAEKLENLQGYLWTKWNGKSILFACTNGAAEIDTETGMTTVKSTAKKDTGSNGTEEAFQLRGTTIARCLRTGEGSEAKGVFEMRDLRKGGWQTLPGFDAHSSIDFCPSPDERFGTIKVSTSSVPIVMVFSASGALLDLFARDKPKSAALQANPDTARPRQPAEYADLAKNLSDPWFELGKTKPEKDSIQAIAEANAAILDLTNIATNDKDIRFAATEATDSFRALVASVQRFEELPKPPGLAAQFAEGLALGFLGQLEEAGRLSLQHRAEAESLLGEGRRASAAFQRAHAAKLLLPRIAARYAGPEVRSGQAVDIKFHPRWGPNNSVDQILIEPQLAGIRELHNCTVLVEIMGESGAVAKNVHFLPVWADGTAYYAHYHAGVDFGTGRIVGRQTLSGHRGSQGFALVGRAGATGHSLFSHASQKGRDSEGVLQGSRV